jgi:hypothetical protein
LRSIFLGWALTELFAFDITAFVLPNVLSYPLHLGGLTLSLASGREAAFVCERYKEEALMLLWTEALSDSIYAVIMIPIVVDTSVLGDPPALRPPLVLTTPHARVMRGRSQGTKNPPR